jgi:S-adenosylmethionine:tRNA ribosyltransferase-isomerase
VAVLSEYDYELPPGLIAQHPAVERDRSRLMALDRGGAILHRTFSDLPDLLDPGDLLVVNDTRVFPARLIGRKEGTGGEVEIFLLHPAGNNGSWEVLARPSRRIKPGTVVLFGEGILSATVEGRGEDGCFRVRLESEGDTAAAIDRVGRTPLPPYIRREPEETDSERYQTVYARHRGAAAAPTAGLHFTGPLLETLASRGIGTAPVTLHVGVGTFRPLTEEDFRGETLHREYCRVSEETVSLIRSARARGGKIVAVGTTTVRALETASASGDMEPFEGWTDLFIKPPHSFKGMDALITNFHLPRSSLLILVSAFAGRERLLGAYRTAVEEGYRFYSYGDAMLIFGRETPL